MYRLKSKKALRAALLAAGVPTNKRGAPNNAEIERRLKVLLGDKGPSRQYLSRILGDGKDPTTSQWTAEGLAYIARQPVTDLFTVETVGAAR